MNCENTNKGNTTVQQQSSEDSRIPCTPESVKIWNTKQKNNKLAQDDREKKNENSDETRKQFTFEKFCQHKLKEHIKIRKPENFQPYISKVAIATAAESWKHLYEKNNFCHPVTLVWFSIQILVISKFSKLS